MLTLSEVLCASGTVSFLESNSKLLPKSVEPHWEPFDGNICDPMKKNMEPKTNKQIRALRSPLQGG